MESQILEVFVIDGDFQKYFSLKFPIIYFSQKMLKEKRGHSVFDEEIGHNLVSENRLARLSKVAAPQPQLLT